VVWVITKVIVKVAFKNVYYVWVITKVIVKVAFKNVYYVWMIMAGHKAIALRVTTP